MNLTEIPQLITWPVTHYLFIEKTGSFQETAAPAWLAVHQAAPSIEKTNTIVGYLSLYRLQPKMIYRAGLSLAAKPLVVPQDFRYAEFAGGPYYRFVLTGPFSDLPAACGRVFEIIEEKGLKTGDNFYLESYVSDPRKTPEAELITHLLVPAVG